MSRRVSCIVALVQVYTQSHPPTLRPVLYCHTSCPHTSLSPHPPLTHPSLTHTHTYMYAVVQVGVLFVSTEREWMKKHLRKATNPLREKTLSLRSLLRRSLHQNPSSHLSSESSLKLAIG